MVLGRPLCRWKYLCPSALHLAADPGVRAVSILMNLVGGKGVGVVVVVLKCGIAALSIDPGFRGGNYGELCLN